jgi:hypothetical protein
MNIVLLISLLAAVDPVGCPKTIQVNHQLAGLTFFDGKPEENASLAPDDEKRRKHETVSTWKFDKARPTWVVCRYAGIGTTLTRELPRNTSTCVVTYTRGATAIAKIDCTAGNR